MGEKSETPAAADQTGPDTSATSGEFSAGPFRVVVNVQPSGEEVGAELLTLTCSAPSVYAQQREIKLSTDLRSFFAERLASAVSASAADTPPELQEAIVNQAIVNFEHYLLGLLTRTADFVRDVAYFAALLDLADPERIAAWKVNDFSMAPSRSSVFDVTKDARAARKDQAKRWAAVFDQLFPVSHGNAPDTLPGEVAAMKLEIDEEFSRLKAEDPARSVEKIFAEMTRKRYGPQHKNLSWQRIRDLHYSSS